MTAMLELHGQPTQGTTLQSGDQTIFNTHENSNEKL